jgi:dihydropteroate synthase
VRVHDVLEMRDVVNVAEAIVNARIIEKKHYNGNHDG